jgi:Rrf2 family protein
MMKLSTRTRYGIRAALELAVNHGRGPLQTKVIAQRQNISVKYLEQLMALLKAGGIVRSIRGSRGGYVLARAPNEVRMSDVFNALEGPVVPVECLEDRDYCTQVPDCMARYLWAQVQQAIQGVLESMTVQDLIEKARDGRTRDYQI